MSTVDQHLQKVLDRAAGEARADGSPEVEAQHLLLALAADPGIAALLGADRGVIRAALDREFEESLAAVGVTLPGGLRRGASAGSDPGPDSGSGLGASAKAALERAFAAAHRKRDLRLAHLLLGVATGQAGTVPRALALAGIDQTALISRTIAAQTRGDAS